jgi:hypothetical protein
MSGVLKYARMQGKGEDAEFVGGQRAMTRRRTRDNSLMQQEQPRLRFAEAA